MRESMKTTAPHLFVCSDAGDAYTKEGVDLTLIRWMLTLTPEERLNVLQDTISSIHRLRHAGTKTHVQRDFLC